MLVAGFIVFEDGRAWAASNWATDTAIRAIAQEVEDPSFREWLLAQAVGGGLSYVDAREIAPRFRPAFFNAIRKAAARIRREPLTGEDQLEVPYWDTSYVERLGELLEMMGGWQTPRGVQSAHAQALAADWPAQGAGLVNSLRTIMR